MSYNKIMLGKEELTMALRDNKDKGSKNYALLLQCANYMRLQAENSVPPKEKIQLLKTSPTGDGIIQYFQWNETFGREKGPLRDVIVSMLEPPFVLDNKIIPSGIVSQKMLDELQLRITEGSFTTFEQCQEWIHATYQSVYDYIVAYEKYTVKPEEVALPHPPSMLPRELFELIREVVASATPEKLAEQKPVLAQSYNAEWKPVPVAASAAAAPVAPAAFPDFKKMHFAKDPKKSLERGNKLYGFFKQAKELADSNLGKEKRLELLHRVEKKINKYEKEGLPEEEYKEIHRAFSKVLKL